MGDAEHAKVAPVRDGASPAWPQKIRLARKGKAPNREGDLYIGRMDDAAQFRVGLIIHVGFDDAPSEVSQNEAVRVRVRQMSDGANRISEWVEWLDVVQLAVRTIRSGTDVLVTCDQGVSRSVTTAAAVISLLDDLPMDYPNLARELRNRYWDGASGMTLPSKALWDEAAAVLSAFREYEEGKRS